MNLARLMCRIFGHRMFDECYAVKHSNRYVVVKRSYCERCGKELTHTASHKLSRTQLLSSGWFIINNH